MPFMKPTPAAAKTLPESHRHGWWGDPAIFPRNKQDQRIKIDGRSYQIRETHDWHQEYIDNRYREGEVWEVEEDPNPLRPTPYRPEDERRWPWERRR